MLCLHFSTRLGRDQAEMGKMHDRARLHKHGTIDNAYAPIAYGMTSATGSNW